MMDEQRIYENAKRLKKFAQENNVKADAADCYSAAIVSEMFDRLVKLQHDKVYNVQPSKDDLDKKVKS